MLKKPVSQTTGTNHYCKKIYFNIPHKAPFDLDSSLLSPQSSIKLQTSQSQIHLPLLHWNLLEPHKFPKCKTKLTDNNKSSFHPEPTYKYYPLNFQYDLEFRKTCWATEFFPLWELLRPSKPRKSYRFGCLYYHKGKLV